MAAYECEHSSPVNRRDWRDVICVSAMAVRRDSSNRQSSGSRLAVVCVVQPCVNESQEIERIRKKSKARRESSR